MTKTRKAFRLFGCVVATSACFGADDAVKPALRMSAPEHFESHAAWLLQRMVKVNLSLTGAKAHAVDLVFADYYRRTGEHLPRPVLIAYPLAQRASPADNAKEAVLSAQVGQHIEGKIQRTADGLPVMLVESILKVLDSSQEPAFRSVVRRWAQIKPEPISIPIIELMRAARDPLLKLTPGQRDKLDTILMLKSEQAMNVPILGSSSSRIDPLIDGIRLELLAVLTPRQRAQFEATLTFVEQDSTDWRELKTGGDALYAQAVALLEQEAKKKKSSGD